MPIMSKVLKRDSVIAKAASPSTSTGGGMDNGNHLG